MDTQAFVEDRNPDLHAIPWKEIVVPRKGGLQHYVFPLRGLTWETSAHYGKDYRTLDPVHWRWGDDDYNDEYLPEGMNARNRHTTGSHAGSSQQKDEVQPVQGVPPIPDDNDNIFHTPPDANADENFAEKEPEKSSKEEPKARIEIQENIEVQKKNYTQKGRSLAFQRNTPQTNYKTTETRCFYSRRST